MRKYAFLLIIILMLGAMTACSANDMTPVNADMVTDETTSALVSESPATTPESEPTDTSENDPTETPSQTVVSEAPTPVPENSSEPAAPPKSDTPMESSKPAVSTAPTITPPPAASTPPTTSAPNPAESPAQPAFDINDWIAFAKSYGQQIGLIYDEGTTGSWDNPIPASPTAKYIERDIKAGLNFAKTMNQATYFSVWVEKQADGKYDIYIGYA